MRVPVFALGWSIVANETLSTVNIAGPGAAMYLKEVQTLFAAAPVNVFMSVSASLGWRHPLGAIGLVWPAPKTGRGMSIYSI